MDLREKTPIPPPGAYCWSHLQNRLFHPTHSPEMKPLYQVCDCIVGEGPDRRDWNGNLDALSLTQQEDMSLQVIRLVPAMWTPFHCR